MNGFAKHLDYEEFLAFFDLYGGTHEVYLRDHYQRFRKTLDEFSRTWSGGIRVLDIGAHCLHQSVMWSQNGYAVTAIEFPEMFAAEGIRRIAQDCRIRLHGCADLARAAELDAIPDNSADVVLLTEVLEHITFNPIQLWKQIHRILSPNGRILITTPNYYSWRGRAWQWMRFVRGFGGGISVSEVVGQGTYAHHWKEYSLGEVRHYFEGLSPDFLITKAKIVPTFMRSKIWWKNVAQCVLDTAPTLRPNLHIEVSLAGKNHGVIAKARY
jgi:2-polyprenyl-6-hydroxyphenyl methylase/3-demethylubiquinone-9 3-methyltransferase